MPGRHSLPVEMGDMDTRLSRSIPNWEGMKNVVVVACAFVIISTVCFDSQCVVSREFHPHAIQTRTTAEPLASNVSPSTESVVKRSE